MSSDVKNSGFMVLIRATSDAPFCRSSSLSACAALPAITVYIGVFIGVLVPTRAMSLFEVVCSFEAAKQVFRTRDRLKMIGVCAGAVPAQAI